ncbi:cell wall hydrolase [Hwanghaeella sp. LZ110]|uniref:cell wall hydrolase n=1 Tax=Hwanghaeella sp. LZ110 TaxID=3402810 RepID=UPI003B682FEA
MRAILLVALSLILWGYNKMKLNEAQLTMARTMYGEARGEGATGMQAVGNVIMNRALLGGWWGNSIVSVALKPWQFSAWNANDPNRDVIANLMPGDNQTFDLAYEIAGKLIDGDLPDITGGATHYYADTISEPGWARGANQTAYIGHHKFFNEVA